MYLTLERVSGLNRLDKIIVMQDIEDLPRVLSGGFVTALNETSMTVYVENDNFCTTMPVLIVKIADMIKVDTPEGV